MYVIFLLEFIPALLVLINGYDYVLKALTKDKKYSESLQSRNEFLSRYPVIGIIGLIAGIYIIYNSFFSENEYYISTTYKIIDLCVAFLDILCFLKAAHLFIENKL